MTPATGAARLMVLLVISAMPSYQKMIWTSTGTPRKSMR